MIALFLCVYAYGLKLRFSSLYENYKTRYEIVTKLYNEKEKTHIGLISLCNCNCPIFPKITTRQVHVQAKIPGPKFSKCLNPPEKLQEYKQ